jgi:hypothetical protein
MFIGWKCPANFRRQSGTVLKWVGNCGKSKAVFYKHEFDRFIYSDEKGKN